MKILGEQITMTTNEDVIQRIKTFLARRFGGRQFSNQDDIIALGFGNSLFAMQLVTFMEREFGIEIGGEDLRFENFRTVTAMSNLVCSRLVSSAASGPAPASE